MPYGIVLLPTVRQPSVSCSILQLFDYLCHYSHCHLLSIRLGIRCLSCSITFWLSQTCCFLSAHMHSRVHLSLTQTVTCLTIVSHSHFTSLQVLAFCPICLSTLCLLHTFPCSHIIAIVHQCLLCSVTVFFLHLCTLCSWHTPCPLHPRSAMHSSCPMHTHCLLPLCAIAIHSTLVTSSSPAASASCWLYAHSLLWTHFLFLMVHPARCIF